MSVNKKMSLKKIDEANDDLYQALSNQYDSISDLCIDKLEIKLNNINEIDEDIKEDIPLGISNEIISKIQLEIEELINNKFKYIDEYSTKDLINYYN